MKILPIPNTSEQPLWDLWLGIYQLGVVTAADEIGLFAQLYNAPLRYDELAKSLKITEKALRALVGVLVGLDFVRAEGNIIHLTATSETYLVPTQPFYWGILLENFRNRPEHQRILDAIKCDNEMLMLDGKSVTHMWETGEISPQAAEKFTQSMQTTIYAAAMGAVKKGVFAGTKNLLDMGGGSGCFSIAYVKEYPGNKATIFELPAVCEVTKKYLAEFSAEEFVTLYSGNFFKDEWPKGHDAILFSQIFHDWPIDHCRKLAKYAYEALEKNGKIYIHEMLLEENYSPLTTACFNLLMYVNHRSQQFTQLELFQLLSEAGFKNLRQIKTFGYHSMVIADK